MRASYMLRMNSMREVIRVVFLACVFMIGFCHAKAETYTNYVDPFIGSDDTRWVYFSPVSVPLGLIASGPITSGVGGYDGGGNKIGYEYGSRYLYGISAIKEYQLSSLLILPICGVENQHKSEVVAGSEKARPGYYAVDLKNGNSLIKLEATSTQRSLAVRSNFEHCDDKKIVVRYSEALGEGGLAGENKSSGYAEVFKNGVGGWTEIEPPYLKKRVRVYFYIDTKGKDFSVQKDRIVFYSKAVDDLRVGISFTGIDGAVKNIQESAEKSFEVVKEQAGESWDVMLSRVVVDSVNKKDKIKFYTALWNVIRSKNIVDDVDGAYLAYNGTIGFYDNSKLHIFNTDSLWGSHWTLNQVYSLFFEDLALYYARGLLKVYDDTGWMPDGWAVNETAPGMPTNTSSIFLASLITKKLLANSAILKEAILKNNKSIDDRPYGFGKEGMRDYVLKGYIPIQEGVYGAASSTVERSFDDFCANNAIKILTGTGDPYLSRSMLNHRQLLDSNAGWFVPLQPDGSFVQHFNPESGAYFAEGNSYQYTFYPVHDLKFIVASIGPLKYKKRLEQAIVNSSAVGYSLNGNTSGYSSLNYNPGNQVSMQMPWIFHALNEPEKTWFYVNDVLSRFYGTTPTRGYGIKQDEDQGQLSAWFLLSSLGLFDLAGNCDSKTIYSLIPPLFKEVRFRIAANDFVIKNDATNPGSGFCVAYNGELRKPYITYEELRSGGELHFTNGCD